MTNPFESEGLVEELSIAGEERATMGLTSRAEEGGFGGYLELEEARGPSPARVVFLRTRMTGGLTPLHGLLG